MLKFNAKNYLQQDLRDYVFDCYVVAPRGKAQPEAGKSGVTKYKVWVGGARNDYLVNVSNAIKAAGLIPGPSDVDRFVGPVKRPRSGATGRVS